MNFVNNHLGCKWRRQRFLATTLSEKNRVILEKKSQLFSLKHIKHQLCKFNRPNKYFSPAKFMALLDMSPVRLTPLLNIYPARLTPLLNICPVSCFSIENLGTPAFCKITHWMLSLSSFCHETDSCRYFTHYGHDKTCLAECGNSGGSCTRFSGSIIKS